MTERKEELKRIETIIHYVATDGTEFQDKEECEKYEQSAKCALKSNFNKLVIKSGTEQEFFTVGEDCDAVVYAVKMKTAEDVLTVKQLWAIDHPYVYKDDYTVKEEYKDWVNKAFGLIDKAYEDDDILFVEESYDEGIYILNTRNNVYLKLMNIQNDTEREDKGEPDVRK